jgi:hypothetical protein
VAVFGAGLRPLVEEAVGIVLSGCGPESGGVVDVVDFDAEDGAGGKFGACGELEGFTGYAVEGDWVAVRMMVFWRGWVVEDLHSANGDTRKDSRMTLSIFRSSVRLVGESFPSVVFS